MNSDALKSLVEITLEDMKGLEPACLDVKLISNFADYMIVVTATSNRHVKSLAEEVIKKVKEAGLSVVGVEGQDQADWVLIDLGDVVVHVMLADTRKLYDLESLWAATNIGDDETDQDETGGE